jgi:predicted enzyme related to lactoylglutathione lyase
MGPHQVPGGNWVLHGRDPQGAVFALMSMTK